MKRGRNHLARAMSGAALLSAVLLAGGCVKPVEEPDNAHMSTLPEQERQAPTQPAVRPNDPLADQAQKTPEPASKQPSQEPVLPAEPTVQVFSASELMGKSQAEVTDLMGTPVRVEQRAASTVWVYQGGECGLDVFFFLDMATSAERVLTVSPTAETAIAAATEPAPAAEPAAEQVAAEPAPAPEGSVVDVCYGKLRRS